jgi:hypothetical protein
MVRQESFEETNMEEEEEGRGASEAQLQLASSELESEPAAAIDEPVKASRGSSGALLLFLVGFLLAGGGTTLVFADRLSWELGEVGARLTEMGLQSGLLLLGGLVFFGMAIVARSNRSLAAARPAPEPESSVESDFMLVADQLATDVAQMLTSLLQMSGEIASLGEGQRTLLTATQHKDEVPDQQHNAIFRLAASVDKLSAHLDERLHDYDLQLRSRLESMANSFHESRASLEARIASVAQETAAPAPQAAAHQPQAAAHQPQAAAPTQGEPAIEFFDDMERLESSGAQDADDGPPAPFAAGGDVDPLDALLPDDGFRLPGEDA